MLRAPQLVLPRLGPESSSHRAESKILRAEPWQRLGALNGFARLRLDFAGFKPAQVADLIYFRKYILYHFLCNVQSQWGRLLSNASQKRVVL